MPARYPERIVCLTEETTETLYLLGEERRIVGISGYTVRPPRARREKPRVSAFLSAKQDAILALKPDLVLSFSDLQADIARDLAKAGLNVVLFNQRSVDEILSMVLMLASMVGAAERGAALVRQLETGLEEMRQAAARLPRRPRVYFEEWDELMISGIRWVSELVGIAGGDDVFAELSRSQAATGRIVQPDAVLGRRPDVMIASWCGKESGLELRHRHAAIQDLTPAFQGPLMPFASKAPARRLRNSRRTVSFSRGSTLMRPRRPRPQSSQRSTPHTSMSPRITLPSTGSLRRLSPTSRIALSAASTSWCPAIAASISE